MTSDYHKQRSVGSTIVKGSSLKEAMAAARSAFGKDVPVLNVERVGGTYCIEVSSSLNPQDSGDVLVEKAIGALEQRFSDLVKKLSPAGLGTQAEGLGSAVGMRADLGGMGFAEPFLSKLAGALLDSGAMSSNRDVIMKILASWMASNGAAPDLTSGWHAIVGPSGSGKTTTIAKLAARAVNAYGAGSVGLIATDFYKIGAVEQLKVFGDLLGVKVFTARTDKELATLKESLARQRIVVYVDTIGTSRDDERMRSQMSLLSSLGISSTLALQACLERTAMRVDLSKWRAAGAASALITKLDQALVFAPLVENLIIEKMPFSYASNGQKVPDDLHKISPLFLAHKASRPPESQARGNSVDQL